MRLLWLSWRDSTHPQAGGAEVVKSEIIKRLTADGHEVVLLSGAFPGGQSEEIIDGARIIRRGSKWTVALAARNYYKRHLQDWPDAVIEEINTMPYMAHKYIRQPSVLFFHMLCREIWYYQMPQPFSAAGFHLIEPAYLKLLSKRPVITVSDSTRSDLMKYGFQFQNIQIISEGIEIQPLDRLDTLLSSKFKAPTILAFGSVRPMKRTAHIVRAFELAKNRIANLQLKIAGDASGSYGEEVLSRIKASRYCQDIEYAGKVSKQQKQQLMAACHLLAVASVKEGWGLVVTEAASQGTPSVAYDVDGLRDSVREGETGWLCEPNSEAMASAIIQALGVKKSAPQSKYDQVRQAGWEWSKEITFDRAYEDFKKSMTFFTARQL